MRRRPIGAPLVEGIDHLHGLDRPAERFAAAVRGLVRRGVAKDALSGSWLGHAVHPMLVVVPIGAWTGVAVLDVLGGRDSARSRELLIGLGVAAAVPAIVAGLHDWAESERGRSEVRRIGVVHGATNSMAFALHVASLAQRLRGRHVAGVRLARGGFCVLIVGDWLGGHVAFALGAGVNHAAFDEAPRNWTAVLDVDALDDRQPVNASADGIDSVIVRIDGAIYALAKRCGHCGASLARGRVVGETIQCPLNDTRFRLSDGAIERGPSAYPQPAFEARERSGRIEIRARRR